MLIEIWMMIEVMMMTNNDNASVNSTCKCPVGKCPAPGQCNICKCPTPGTDKAGKCPAVARGGDWAPVELTDET